MADDHARIRAKVRESLEAGGWDVCGEGATAGEAIALALEHRPDVVLLDINMPGNGISAAQAISRTLPETAVVMPTADHGTVSQTSADSAVILTAESVPRPIPGCVAAGPPR